MNNKRSIDSLDLAKFCLSFLVMALHVRPIFFGGGGYELLKVFCRLAVPLYFIISGYLFFGSLRNTGIEEQRARLKKYESRLLKLHIAWFIILLPITILNRSRLNISLGWNLVGFMVSIPFGSTFGASWYLTALIEGTAFVFFLKRRNNVWIFAIGIICYFVCCLWSGYGRLLGVPIAAGFPQPQNSVLVSIIWITIGKIYSENEESINSKIKALHNGFKLLVVMFYALEYYLCFSRGWCNNTDALLFLIPICTLLFYTIRNVKIDLQGKGKKLRSLSTITYCLHSSLALALKYLMMNIFHFSFKTTPQNLLVYIVNALLCFSSGMIIIHCSNSHRKTLIYLKQLY